MKKTDWTITVEALPEDIPVRGNASEDKEVEDRILEDLENGNEWAWCTVAVTVRFRDCLEHIEYLGCCSYDSRQDFIANSGYYEDMVDECKKQIERMRKDLVRRIE